MGSAFLDSKHSIEKELFWKPVKQDIQGFERSEKAIFFTILEFLGNQDSAARNGNKAFLIKFLM